ncbi:Arc family DNA-binding protein [Pseudomonas sp. NFACC37-1]|uniref:Arc family DNA-binding protein n=1 Tax=Pseudomonas sp. NFACC37-1 TaxID=1566196 RepID=UPI00088AB082|nr:Arc-like DNA binding domain-containing protein [Pseudomonas sp. NFACC37-1]
MSSPNYDSRTADKFVARLPDGLRAEIEAAAAADDRSMNSVFVQAVRQYLDGQKRQQLLLDALAHMVMTPTASASMHIDDRVRMAANAKRYEWLRDVGRVDDAEDTVVAGRGIHCFYGEDLDREIDDAMRLQRLQELHP